MGTMGINGCTTSSTEQENEVPSEEIKKKDIDWQGHRGCRGLYPENTIPAFKKALDLGIETLELDVVISGDGNVIVSHEPWFSHEITTLKNGDSIAATAERRYNIFEMTLDEIAEYDCGSRPHSRFPEQKKLNVQKPSLNQLVSELTIYCNEKGYDLPYYNIEIKSAIEYDNVFAPEPAQFVKLVLAELYRSGIEKSCNLQSFDPRSMNEIHLQDSSICTAFLVENEKSINTNLAKLNFTPEIYSPWYKVISKEDVKNLHNKGIKVIVWTVNEVEDMKKMIDFDVDGIITDYPDRRI